MERAAVLARSMCCAVYVVCVVCVVCVVGAGCSSPHPPYWTVEKNGKTSVLFGTMHAEVDIDVLAPELFDDINRARIVITEADVRSVDAGEFQTAITLPQGESVRAAVSPADWELIRSGVVGVVNEGTAELMQPWFLEGQIVGTRLPPVKPIDANIVVKASAHDVPLGFFETWQEQVEVLNGLGFDDGLDTLLRSARDPQGAVKEHLAWGAVYSAGDVDKMTALAFDPQAMAARPAYYDDVVFRHARWLPQLEHELDLGNAFVATGFMHMLTDRGLPALLAQDGYNVTAHD